MSPSASASREALPLLLMSEYFLPQKGGSVTWLANLYQRFAPDGITVLAGGPEPASGEVVRFPHPIERAPMSMPDRDPTVLATFGPYRHLYSRARALARSHGVRQIHVGKVLPEGWVAYWMRRLHGVPYVLFAHGEEITTGLLSRRLRFVLPLIYRGAAAVIANSDHTRGILEGIGVRAERIHVIHPSVPAEDFEGTEERGRALRERHRISPEDPVLLTVGRLQRRKGHDVTIQALPTILARHPEARYVVVGSGEERDSLGELARELGVAEHVLFLGAVPDEDLVGWYGACDLFLMPNRTVNQDIEGFGIVFLEAAAAGRAAIAGNTGGTREAVVDGVTGFLVDGAEPAAVAAAVLRLLDDPALARRLGAAGRERVRRDFSYDRSAARLREIARNLEGSRG
ncbi:MAG: glycosyltransferase family 4 protein [bacterium]